MAASKSPAHFVKKPHLSDTKTASGASSFEDDEEDLLLLDQHSALVTVAFLPSVGAGLVFAFDATAVLAAVTLLQVATTMLAVPDSTVLKTPTSLLALVQSSHFGVAAVWGVTWCTLVYSLTCLSYTTKLKLLLKAKSSPFQHHLIKQAASSIQAAEQKRHALIQSASYFWSLGCVNGVFLVTALVLTMGLGNTIPAVVRFAVSCLVPAGAMAYLTRPVSENGKDVK